MNLGPPFRAFGLYTLRALDYRSWTDMVARATAERRHARRVYHSLHWMPVGAVGGHDPRQVIS
jgi:hypothetical protein